MTGATGDRLAASGRPWATGTPSSASSAEGGMATVYLAQDLKHDRPVALKVLHPELAATLGSERFRARSRSRAASSTRTSSALIDSGEPDGLPLLRDAVRRRGDRCASGSPARGQLPVDDAISIAREIAEALEYAHRARRDPPRHQAGEHPARRAATPWWPTSGSPARSASAGGGSS